MDRLLSNRLVILAGVALLLFSILIARWIGNWGLVTVHVKDVPLSKVIASIARQGHIQLETSLDLSKPVSLDVDCVTAAEAIDALSVRADASWYLVYLAAPTMPALKAALITLQANGKIEDWTTYYYPGPPMSEIAGVAVDARSLPLKIEGTDLDLSKLLNEAAQKSGVMTAFPKDWSPNVSRIPKPEQLYKSIPSMIASAHGKSREFFFLTERGKRDRPPVETAQGEKVQEPEINADWIEARAIAQLQIAHLSPEKQAEAKQEIQEHKALFADMKKLSPEERRAKWKALMNNPDFIEKMIDQRMMRDAKMSANQRISRAVNYLNRKASIQAAGIH